jgi:RNase P protein component
MNTAHPCALDTWQVNGAPIALPARGGVKGDLDVRVIMRDQVSLAVKRHRARHTCTASAQCTQGEA